MVKEYDEGENQFVNVQLNGLFIGRCIQEVFYVDLFVFFVVYGEDYYLFNNCQFQEQVEGQLVNVAKYYYIFWVILMLFVVCVYKGLKVFNKF